MKQRETGKNNRKEVKKESKTRLSIADGKEWITTEQNEWNRMNGTEWMEQNIPKEQHRKKILRTEQNRTLDFVDGIWIVLSFASLWCIPVLFRWPHLYYFLGFQIHWNLYGHHQHLHSHCDHIGVLEYQEKEVNSSSGVASVISPDQWPSCNPTVPADCGILRGYVQFECQILLLEI